MIKKYLLEKINMPTNEKQTNPCPPQFKSITIQRGSGKYLSHFLEQNELPKTRYGGY